MDLQSEKSKNNFAEKGNLAPFYYDINTIRKFYLELQEEEGGRNN